MTRARAASSWSFCSAFGSNGGLRRKVASSAAWRRSGSSPGGRYWNGVGRELGPFVTPPWLSSPGGAAVVLSTSAVNGWFELDLIPQES